MKCQVIRLLQGITQLSHVMVSQSNVGSHIRNYLVSLPSSKDLDSNTVPPPLITGTNCPPLMKQQYSCEHEEREIF